MASEDATEASGNTISSDSSTVDSGLMDIRSLAGEASPRGPLYGVDDLVSSAGGASSSYCDPLPDTPDERLNRRLKFGLLIGGAVFVCVVVLVVTLLIRKSERAPVVQTDKLALLQQQLDQLKSQVTDPIANPQLRAAGQQLAIGAGQIGAVDPGVPQKAASRPKMGWLNNRAADKRPPVPKTRVAKNSRVTNDSRPAKSKSPIASPDPIGAPESDARPPADQGIFRAGATDAPAAAPSTEAEVKKDTVQPAVNADRKMDELDYLIGPAAKGSPKKEKLTPPTQSAPSQEKQPAPTKAGGAAVASLSRHEVQGGMKSVAASVQRCANGQSGTISVRVTIGQQGGVLGASTIGAHAGTSVGRCAAQAVRIAKFPKFNGPNLTVKYPFKL